MNFTQGTSQKDDKAKKPGKTFHRTECLKEFYRV